MLTPRISRWPMLAFLAIPLVIVVFTLWHAPAPRQVRTADPEGAPGNPRIVVLSPAIGVILRDLGLESRIVGRHGFDIALDKTIPVCGDQTGLDYEALVRAGPTHVFMESGAAGVPARLTDLASQRGWVVQGYPMLTLDDIRACTAEVAAAFGVRSGDILSRMASAWSRRDNLYTGRVLLLAATDPPFALGPRSFHYQLLERLGGVPAITAGSPYITLTTEDVLRLAPGAIILILPRLSGEPSPAVAPTHEELVSRLGRIGTLDIPAIRGRRIALIDDPLAQTPSTAMIGLAEELARVLEGWNRASDGP